MEIRLQNLVSLEEALRKIAVQKQWFYEVASRIEQGELPEDAEQRAIIANALRQNADAKRLPETKRGRGNLPKFNRTLAALEVHQRHIADSEREWTLIYEDVAEQMGLKNSKAISRAYLEWKDVLEVLFPIANLAKGRKSR